MQSLALDHLRCQFQIGLAAAAFKVVEQHRLAVRRRFGHSDIARDDCFIDLIAHEPPHIRDDLRGERIARIKHRQNNAMDGQPFFVINKEIDPGLLQVLEDEIVPRLEAEIPAQPAMFELMQSSYIHRFTMVFDREGYSPGFMKRMRNKRIACQTYHKYQGEDWPEEEFQTKPVRLVSDCNQRSKIQPKSSF